jgi:hypothetical protein
MSYKNLKILRVLRVLKLKLTSLAILDIFIFIYFTVVKPCYKISSYNDIETGLNQFCLSHKFKNVKWGSEHQISPFLNGRY